MATTEESLVYEAVIEKEGVKVSKSPWGPDDEIGRLNWITPETNAAILGHLDGRHVFDLNVEYFIGMPSWVAAGDPKYEIWMTHTPQGSINDNLSGVGSHVHEKYSYCGDSIHMYTHCGTHIDTLNHLGFYGQFWNGWTADKDLGSRLWNKGGLEHYPPVIARGVLLDVAGLHGVDCLPDGYAITPDDLRKAASEQGVEIQPKSVVLVRTGRMTKWPDFDGYLANPPGIGLPAAKYLCEEAGAMCIAGDSIALEVLPSEDKDVFLPVHAYMFATAGAQIMEVVNMEEIAAEKQYEFAFLGFPLKLRGATGAPMPAYAVPLRD
ncbi:MAG TPA: cyclase family protein [Gaiellaceae bacterium]|nr:cyclase family protein [Gaiellaceae bacterium]